MKKRKIGEREDSGSNDQINLKARFLISVCTGQNFCMNWPKFLVYIGLMKV